jgi:hypothetical protein
MAREKSDQTQTNDEAERVANTTQQASQDAGAAQDASGSQDGLSENRDGDGIEDATDPDDLLTDDERQAAATAQAQQRERTGLALFEMRPISELAMNYRKLADEGRLDSRTSELFAGVIRSLEAISEQLDELRAVTTPPL